MNDSGEQLTVLSGATIEKPYGWVFFYQSKAFLDTGDNSHRLAGNGPVVFLNDDQSIHYLGSAESVASTIAEFEREKGLAP